MLINLDWLSSLHWGALMRFIDRMTLLTPGWAILTIIVVILALTLFIVSLWLARSRRNRPVVLASLLLPLSLITVLRASSGFNGTPDDNCGTYEDGKAIFSVLHYTRIPSDERDPYGQGWLILIVRSEGRWGNEPHQCRLSFADAKTRELSLLLPNMCTVDGASFHGWSRGLLTLSFGGGNDKPNVTFPKVAPEDEKRGPPEVPPQGRKTL